MSVTDTTMQRDLRDQLRKLVDRYSQELDDIDRFGAALHHELDQPGEDPTGIWNAAFELADHQEAMYRTATSIRDLAATIVKTGAARRASEPLWPRRRA